MGKKTSIYLTDELTAKLRLNEDRGLSTALNETIDRYEEIIASERKRVQSMFSESEWNAMRNACNATLWHPAATIRDGVLVNIQDSLDEELDYYGADRETLEGKLRSLSVAQQFTLVEIIAQWWSDQ